jgi:hypothetical protein
MVFWLLPRYRTGGASLLENGNLSKKLKTGTSKKNNTIQPHYIIKILLFVLKSLRKY